MFTAFRSLALSLICALVAFAAQSQSAVLDVTVTYRERIALQPDAKLHVQLLELTSAEASSVPLAALVFALSAVPMTVSLTYDPAIVDEERSYAVTVGFWSDDAQVFRALRPYSFLDVSSDQPIEIVLSMVESLEGAAVSPRTMTGVLWAATEVAGVPWLNDDPATLTVDETMTFSIFGGCNRFAGEVKIAAGRIYFPESFAGTLMACPNEVEEQERAFLATLEGHTRRGPP